MTNWPYPRWIAHRGAGKLAPENTLAAFRLGASHGYRMAECDAKLSADGVVFLLHDDTLNRTSNGQGTGGDHLIVRIDEGSASPQAGDTIHITPRADRLHWFDAVSYTHLTLPTNREV